MIRLDWFAECESSANESNLFGKRLKSQSRSAGGLLTPIVVHSMQAEVAQVGRRKSARDGSQLFPLAQMIWFKIRKQMSRSRKKWLPSRKKKCRHQLVNLDLKNLDLAREVRVNIPS